MSTYIDPMNPKRHGDYSDCPPLVVDYLNYSESIRGLSPRTVNAYYIDLRTFFKFLVSYRRSAEKELSPENVDIRGVDLAFIRKIDKSEIYEFLYYVTRERENASATRARKLSTLKGFFRYLTSKTGTLDRNPVDDVEPPKIKKRLPKYLSLDESISLLSNIESDFFERDYCIITLFLNCGLRLTELVGINITDIKDDALRVIGKGNKERTIYLNDACLDAIQKLLDERKKMEKLYDEKALFVSRKTGKRLSARRVQQIVNECLRTAGLDGKGYSTHKLRHTAATLMYQYGRVDMLALKEILGHTNVSTTQIYTHLNTAQLRDAASASPLAAVTVEKQDKKRVDEEADVENSVENVEKPENTEK